QHGFTLGERMRLLHRLTKRTECFGGLGEQLTDELPVAALTTDRQQHFSCRIHVLQAQVRVEQNRGSGQPLKTVLSEKRQEAALLFRRLVLDRAFGARAVIFGLAGLSEALLREGYPHHVERLIGRPFRHPAELVNDLDRQLMRTAINVGQWKHRAASGFAVHLAVQQQAIGVAGL
nr:hypothetical protein [Tanacetum cinerariifolium]